MFVERSGTGRGFRNPRHRSADLLSLLTGLLEGGLPSLTAVLGTCSDGRPVALRLAAATGGRLLVLGEDGAGKTALLRTAIMSVALLNPQRDVQFALLDPNGSLASLSRLPHLLTPLVRDPFVALDLLRFLIDARRDGAAIPHVVVVADDLQLWWRILANEWIELAEVGQDLGIHLIGSFAPPLEKCGLELEWGAALWLVGRLALEQDREAVGVNDLPLDQMSTGSFFALTAREETSLKTAFITSRRAALLAERLWDGPGLDLIRGPGAKKGYL